MSQFENWAMGIIIAGLILLGGFIGIRAASADEDSPRFVDEDGNGFDTVDDRFPDDLQETIGDICDAAVRIQRGEAEIAKQKEIEKVSGTVNLTALNRAGEVIVRERARLIKAMNDFKRIRGSHYDAGACRLVR